MLFRRQSLIPNGLPPDCEALCTSVDNTTSSGCKVSVCCTPEFEMDYFNCFSCAAKALNTTDLTVPQANVDMLFDDCAAEGILLPKLTFPGQNANRTLTSVASVPSQVSSMGSGAQGATPFSQITISTLINPSDPLQSFVSTETSIPSGGPQVTITSLPSGLSPITPSSTPSSALRAGMELEQIVGLVLAVVCPMYQTVPIEWAF
ncbi:hypothetical protein CPC08DRAFT_639291 [Agrocybe pediades]|nr:hypothetical protein CPC08DRAFT_639291 [Agrocybe pediades]